jgi:type VI secretion system secreted protein Hcp
MKNIIFIFVITVLAMGMAVISCDQPTGNQTQLLEEKVASTSLNVMATISGFASNVHKCSHDFVEMFLKIDGIDGESNDPAHNNEIEILDFTFGASMRAISSNSGRGQGNAKVNVQDLSFTKIADKASPELRRFADSGESIPEAVLSLRTICDDEHKYLVITLKDVLISSYQTGNTRGRTSEKFTLQPEVGWDIRINEPV